MFPRFGEYFIKIVIFSVVPMVSLKILVFLVRSLKAVANEHGSVCNVPLVAPQKSEWQHWMISQTNC